MEAPILCFSTLTKLLSSIYIRLWDLREWREKISRRSELCGPLTNNRTVLMNNQILGMVSEAQMQALSIKTQLQLPILMLTALWMATLISQY